MSDTWETDVPAAAPRYRTLEPGLIHMLSTPPRMAAATFCDDEGMFVVR